MAQVEAFLHTKPRKLVRSLFCSIWLRQASTPIKSRSTTKGSTHHTLCITMKQQQETCHTPTAYAPTITKINKAQRKTAKKHMQNMLCRKSRHLVLVITPIKHANLQATMQDIPALSASLALSAFDMQLHVVRLRHALVLSS